MNFPKIAYPVSHDMPKLHALEEDNRYLRSRVKLLETRNEQLEARLREYENQRPRYLSTSSYQAILPSDLKSVSASGDERASECPTIPGDDETVYREPDMFSTTAASVTIPEIFIPTNSDKDDAHTDSSGSYSSPVMINRSLLTPAGLAAPTSSIRDPSTMLLTPPQSASKDRPPVNGFLIPLNSGQSVPIVWQPSIQPRHPRPTRRLYLADLGAKYLHRIVSFLLPHYHNEDSFLIDSKIHHWHSGIYALKNACLVSKQFHEAALPILLAYIRIRHIPYLSALVSTLQSNSKFPHRHLAFPLGHYINGLDLSFAIPREWNSVYVTDLSTLLSLTPNLTTFRSRPLICDTFHPRPVPAPILLALANDQAHSELLTTIDLSMQEGASLMDLAKLFQRCVRLQDVTLGKYLFDIEGPAAAVPSILQLPSLVRLKIYLATKPPSGLQTAIPSYRLLMHMSRWLLPALRTVSLVLAPDVAWKPSVSSTSAAFEAFDLFLNVHGSSIRSLEVRDEVTFPSSRQEPRQMESILLKCRSLRELTMLGSLTAPLSPRTPHYSLRRVVFLGIVPGFGVIGQRGDSSHLIALAASPNGQKRFPAVKEVLFKDESRIPIEWQSLLGPEVRLKWKADPDIDHDHDNDNTRGGGRDTPTPGMNITGAYLWLEDDGSDDESFGTPDEFESDGGCFNGDGGEDEEEDEDSDEDDDDDRTTVRSVTAEDTQIDHSAALVILREELAKFNEW